MADGRTPQSGTHHEPLTGRAYQIVLDGHGTFSAPYIDKERAEGRIGELTEKVSGDASFSIEPWPNHRQSDEESNE